MFSKILAGTTVALSVGKAVAGVSWAGVNIAGFDFGCGTDVCFPCYQPTQSYTKILNRVLAQFQGYIHLSPQSTTVRMALAR